MSKYKIYNIKYDTDSEAVDHLPKEIVIEVDPNLEPDFDPAEDLADKISDQTGYCVFGFDFEKQPLT